MRFLHVILVTAILVLFEGQFQVFQRFPGSKLVLEPVESCFVALKCYENGSIYDGDFYYFA